ncbi:helix-turn-helix domain-containing protein [Inquilinus limosus]|uniref:helix-turn-helix domain-containing protein n=1 Tax=Inquilinus limosus TaxID=171674 RepID=UPI00068C8294|nr:helix-turn-helix domain-containing protein [Inquilinus limosus]
MSDIQTAPPDIETYIDSGDFYAERHVPEPMGQAHWHDHIELNLLLAGGMTYLFNGTRISIGANRVHLFWAAVPHQVIAVEPTADLICVYLPFADFLALPVADAFKSGVMDGRFATVAAPDPIDPLLFQRWAAEWPEGSALRQQILREEVGLRVKRLSLDAVAPDAPADATPCEIETAEEAPRLANAGRRAIARVQAMTDHINAHFGEPVTVEAVAAAGGLHPTNAMAVFKRVLGMTIAQYIRRQRLSRAMMMLVDTDLSIAEVAFGCGYGSLSQFYEEFQRHCRSTPRQYRLKFRR